MRALAKAGIVAAGYFAAALVAAAVVALYVATTQGPDRARYDGMYAFGDALLFLGVLSLAAMPVTATALWFLRPVRWFWPMLAALGAASMLTAAGALLDFLASGSSHGAGPPGSWSALASLRLLLSPAVALPWLLAGALAPSLGLRLVLFGAGAVDVLAFAYYLSRLR